MENTTTPGALSALARYDQAVRNFSPVGKFWAGIAAQLRAEAKLYTGGLRQKRLDRADDCDHRARKAELQWIPVTDVRWSLFCNAWLTIGCNEIQAANRRIDNAGALATRELMARTGGWL